MIPTSDAMLKWLLHISGEQQLHPKPGRIRLREAVKLDDRANEIISTFGKKEFSALVGFVDMQGFSNLVKGKRPREVRNLAAPFIESVIGVARKHQWFIDKTIGDEVMIVMPFVGIDVQLADVDLPTWDCWVTALERFVVDLIDALDSTARQLRFSASFALGHLILDQVGCSGFTEWTFYGNCVNASKRLQCTRPSEDASESRSAHWFMLGAIEDEKPYFKRELESWLNIMPQAGLLQLVDTRLEQKEFKGVGAVCYVAGEPVRKTTT